MRLERAVLRGRGSLPRPWQMRWPHQTSGGTRNLAAPRRGSARHHPPQPHHLRRARRRTPKKGLLRVMSWCMMMFFDSLLEKKNRGLWKIMQYTYVPFVCVSTDQRPRTPSLNGVRGRRNRRTCPRIWMKLHLFQHLKRETQQRQVYKSTYILKTHHIYIYIHWHIYRYI